MELFVLEKEQFEEIRQNLHEIKSALITQGKMTIQKKWISTISAAELLNVSIRTIYKYCHDNLLHPKKVGGILLFDREEIEALIKDSNKY